MQINTGRYSATFNDRIDREDSFTQAFGFSNRKDKARSRREQKRKRAHVDD